MNCGTTLFGIALVPICEHRIEFRIGPVSNRQYKAKEFAIMSLVLTDIQKVTLSIAPLDAAGNPAKVDGVPEWSVSDATLLTAAPAADGLSCVVTTVWTLGSAQVNVSADADLGSGTKTITGTLDIDVTASEATTLGITAGVPEPK